MPTYQTAPLGKWKFPDQIYRMNHKGYGYAGVGQTKTRPMPVVGEENPFTAHERKVALDRLKNNHEKMLGLLGVRNTTDRSQRYENGASLSMSRINGKFRDPAFDYSATAGGLRGGTQKFFYFEEGQKWLENWKNRRIAELNAIQKDDFSAGRPQRIPLAPQYDDLDAILAKVLDQFEAGAFSSGLLDDMNKLQGAFLKIGNIITEKKLAQYMRVIGDIRRQTIKMTTPDAVARQVQQLDRGDEAEEVAEEAAAPAGARRGRPALAGAPEFKLDAKDKKIIKATGLIADRLVRLLEEINRVVNESPEVRKQVMEEIGSRVLGAVSREQSAFGQPGEYATGQQPTRGTLTQRETRIPPQRPPAELEAPPAGTPPVKPF